MVLLIFPLGAVVSSLEGDISTYHLGPLCLSCGMSLASEDEELSSFGHSPAFEGLFHGLYVGAPWITSSSDFFRCWATSFAAK